MAPQQGAWARVRLVEGQSALAIWEVTAAIPEARITVGSDPTAQWPVQGAGIAAAHFQLFWDGAALWVSAAAKGSVFLDGQPIDDWRRLDRGCRVSFGAGVMDIETMPGAGAGVASHHDFGTPDMGADDARTVLYDGTRPSSIPPPIPADAVSDSPPRPALGAGAVSPAEPATAPARPTGRTRTIIVDEAKSLLSKVAAPFRGSRSAPLPPAAEPDFTPRMARRDGSPFARPDFSMEMAALKWHERLPRPTKPQLILAAVVGVVGIAAMAMWGYRLRENEALQQQRAAAQQKAEQEQVQQATAERAGQVRQAIDARDQEVAKVVGEFAATREAQLVMLRAREAAEAELRGRPVDPTIEMEFVDGERRAMEKKGSSMLHKGQYAKALVIYSKLAAVHKDEPAFAAMVTVLKSKLRCVAGRLPTGEPCG